LSLDKSPDRSLPTTEDLWSEADWLVTRFLVREHPHSDALSLNPDAREGRTKEYPDASLDVSSLEEPVTRK